MKKKKIMIIGLDGATFDLIDPLVNAGKLPNIAKLINQGVRGNLISTIPPITPAAWISLFTGKNPSAHGVFNFRAFDLSKYSAFNEEFVTSSCYAGNSIFDIFSQNGYKIASIGTPMTYPPFKINGVMISSGTPRMAIDRSSVYPPAIIDKIGKLEIPVKFGRRNRDYFREYMTANLNKHLSIGKMLLSDEIFDLFMIVFGNTDWAAHQYWECSDKNFVTYSNIMAKKYGKVIEEQYILVDQAIGELLNFVDEDTVLFIVSDHGNGPHPINCVNINYWLKQNGFLHTKKNLAIFYTDYLNNATKSLRNYVSRYKNVKENIKKFMPHVIKKKISTLRLNVNNIKWNLTKAYAVPLMPMFDAIIINIKNKQPQGIVEYGKEYNSLCDGIARELMKIKDPLSNKAVIKAIFRKEDICHNKESDNVPDLIIQYNENYTGGTTLEGNLFNRVEGHTLENNSSSHRLEGILIAFGKCLKKNHRITDANIVDILPTILYTMSLPIFDNLDGKILTDIFETDFLENNKPYIAHSVSKMDNQKKYLNEVEATEIKKNLEGLGYL